MRLKQQMGLQPVAMFAIDRGAPHLPIYTEAPAGGCLERHAKLCSGLACCAQEGYRLLCMDEPLEFFEGFNPTVYLAAALVVYIPASSDCPGKSLHSTF